MSELSQVEFENLIGPISNDLLDLTEVENEKLPTLAEIGNQLPIGFKDQTGILHNTFDLIDWTFETEQQLGMIAEENPDMNFTHYIGEVMAIGIERIGTIEFKKLNRLQRRQLIRTLYMSDALYLYVNIRIKSLGHIYKFKPFKCEKCNFKIDKYAGDLRTLEVKTFDTPPTKKIKLQKGIQYGKDVSEVVTIEPVKWSFMEKMQPDILSNRAKMMVASIQSGVVGLDKAPEEGIVYLTEKHIKEMNLTDINILTREIDEIGGGIRMEYEGECPQCKHQFVNSIDWRYTDFFAASSL